MMTADPHGLMQLWGQDKVYSVNNLFWAHIGSFFHLFNTFFCPDSSESIRGAGESAWSENTSVCTLLLDRASAPFSPQLSCFRASTQSCWHYIMCMQALNVQAASHVETFCSRNTFSLQKNTKSFVFDPKYRDQFGVIVQHLIFWSSAGTQRLMSDDGGWSERRGERRWGQVRVGRQVGRCLLLWKPTIYSPELICVCENRDVGVSATPFWWWRWFLRS